MTRNEKIAAIRSALTDEQREWLAEIIMTADLLGDHVVHVDCDCSSWCDNALQTLWFLAQEFRDG